MPSDRVIGQRAVDVDRPRRHWEVVRSRRKTGVRLVHSPLTVANCKHCFFSVYPPVVALDSQVCLCPARSSCAHLCYLESSRYSVAAQSRILDQADFRLTMSAQSLAAQVAQAQETYAIRWLCVHGLLCEVLVVVGSNSRWIASSQKLALELRKHCG